MKAKLKRPKQSFHDWFDEINRDHFLSDIHRLSCLLYFASKEDSDLDRDVRMELVRKLLTKVESRVKYFSRPVIAARWDGRNWRGVEPIRKRIMNAYGDIP